MYKPPDIITCPAAFLILFLSAFFRGCTCLKCTIQARDINYRRDIGALDSFVGALETSAPPESTP